MGYDGRHPAPPEDLAGREPLIRVNPGPWYRIHRVEEAVIYFGTSGGNRFDDPEGKFGVLYMAEDIFGAFIETFGQETGTCRVTEKDLRARAVSRIRTTRPIRLIDLAASGGLVRIGADNALCSDSHEVSQMWSRALYEHPARADGILYRTRHDPDRMGCALFDHCREIVEAEDLGPMDDPSLSETIGQILEHYRFDLFPG